VQSGGVRSSAVQSGGSAYTADAILGLLGSGWQIVIAVSLVIVTAVGLARLVGRGPTRMTNGVFVTGFLIVAITVVATMAVSCSGAADGRPASQLPR
jgi:hypothetical protein